MLSSSFRKLGFLVKSMVADIVETDHRRIVDVAGAAVVEKDRIFDGDAMDRRERALGPDRRRTAAADDPRHPDVRKFGEEVLRRGGLVRVVPRRAVGIVRLEDDGFVLDVGHIDVADDDVLRLATALGCALEAKARVGAAEGIVPHDDVFHPGREFRTDDKAAVGMINRIVLDQDILAGPVFKRFGAGAGLEADTVVTHVDRTAAHDHALALHDVDAVAVLRIPGAADGHAVDRHVGAVRGDQMEFRGILDGHARHEHTRKIFS